MVLAKGDRAALPHGRDLKRPVGGRPPACRPKPQHVGGSWVRFVFRPATELRRRGGLRAGPVCPRAWLLSRPPTSARSGAPAADGRRSCFVVSRRRIGCGRRRGRKRSANLHACHARMIAEIRKKCKDLRCLERRQTGAPVLYSTRWIRLIDGKCLNEDPIPNNFEPVQAMGAPEPGRRQAWEPVAGGRCRAGAHAPSAARTRAAAR